MHLERVLIFCINSNQEATLLCFWSIFYKDWASILIFDKESFDDLCTIAFCGSASKLKEGTWMRLISEVIQITYGTIIYARVSFFYVNQHSFKFFYHWIYVCVLTTILVLFTIECLRTVILSIISMSMIYMRNSVIMFAWLLCSTIWA